MCVHMCCACSYTLLKRKAKRSSYLFLKQTDRREKGPEVLRGQSSAHPSLREKDKISHPEQKKGPEEPQIIRKRKKRAERQKKIYRQRPESYQRKISARDKASRLGVVFSQFEASCHHH